MITKQVILWKTAEHRRVSAHSPSRQPAVEHPADTGIPAKFKKTEVLKKKGKNPSFIWGTSCENCAELIRAVIEVLI